MPNPDYSGLKSDRKGRAAAPPDPGGKGGKKAGFPMKAAFPNAKLPGKSQSRDRSSGFGRKAKVHPSSKGL